MWCSPSRSELFGDLDFDDGADKGGAEKNDSDPEPPGGADDVEPTCCDFGSSQIGAGSGRMARRRRAGDHERAGDRLALDLHPQLRAAGARISQVAVSAA